MLRNSLSKVPLMRPSWCLRQDKLAVIYSARLISYTNYGIRQIFPTIRPFRLPHVKQPTFKHNQQQQQYLSHTTKVIKPFILPDIGEGINEVEIKSWLIKAGDPVREFDGLCEVESDKATVTISSRFEGTITSLHYEVGDMAKVGKPLVDIQMISSTVTGSNEVGEQHSQGNEGDKSQRIESSSSASCSAEFRLPISNPIVSPPPNRNAIVAALPAARRLAQEKGLDLGLISPTGRQGQILKEDVLNFLKRSDEQQATGRPECGGGYTGRTEPKKLQTKDGEGDELRVPLRGIRRAMFKTMSQSVKIPHFNYSDEIDMTRLIEFNRKLPSSDDGRLSNFAIIIKMVSLALRDHPKLNASVDESGEFMVEKHYHNIGVAVDTKAGLVVPNIKNVQTLTIGQINSELKRLRELGYESKLSPTDLSGGTITLSNIGAIGGIFGVPVLVTPEIVIGALGRTRLMPRFNSQGGIEGRHIMQLVWSADHRVVDGASLSRFSNLLKSYLEEPETALLNLV